MALGDALAHNTHLCSLDMGGNGIGDEGAAALAKGLCRNSTLTELHLDHNDIAQEGMCALENAIGGGTMKQ